MTELKQFHILAKIKGGIDHTIITVSNVLDRRAAEARIDLANYEVVSTHDTHDQATAAKEAVPAQSTPAVEEPAKV